VRLLHRRHGDARQSLLEQHPQPSEAQIRAHMEPNLCRCGTHMRIIAAIKEVAQGGRA
jgi:aerobic-type carbon monoxide dehydrogenase small subunit (CoxS/CutS family)